MIVVLALLLAGAPNEAMVRPSGAQITTPPLMGPDCQRLLATSPGAGVPQLCQAESEMRAAESATPEPAERGRRFAAAAATFQTAAAALVDPGLKMYALEALVRLYDAQHLNEPPAMEQTLRSLVLLMPGNSSPLRRVAQLQEELGLVDAAENTLLEARQQAPGDVEVYRALSQFFARRADQIAADPSRLGGDAGPPARPGAPVTR